jgi:hypothetical protein
MDKQKPPKGYRITVAKAPYVRGITRQRGCVVKINGALVGYVSIGAAIVERINNDRRTVWRWGCRSEALGIPHHISLLDGRHWPPTIEGRDAALADLKAYIIKWLWKRHEAQNT